MILLKGWVVKFCSTENCATRNALTKVRKQKLFFTFSRMRRQKSPSLSPTLYQADLRITNHRRQKFAPSFTLLSFKTRIKWPLGSPFSRQWGALESGLTVAQFFSTNHNSLLHIATNEIASFWNDQRSCQMALFRAKVGQKAGFCILFNILK